MAKYVGTFCACSGENSSVVSARSETFRDAHAIFQYRSRTEASHGGGNMKCFKNFETEVFSEGSLGTATRRGVDNIKLDRQKRVV
jgi:hypothetical protein